MWYDYCNRHQGKASKLNPSTQTKKINNVRPLLFILNSLSAGGTDRQTERNTDGRTDRHNKGVLQVRENL